MNWLILVIISTISVSLAAIFQRVLLKEEQSDPIAYGFFFQILVAILIFIYTQCNGIGFVMPPLKALIPFIISMSVLYALANLTLFKSLQTVEASDVAVITSSKSMCTVIAAALLLGEKVTGKGVFGTLLVILGVIVISWKKKKLKISKGHLMALLAAIFFGLGFANDMFLLNSFEVSSYMVLAFFLPSIVILMFKPKSVSNLKLFLDKKRLFKMLLASFYYGVSALTIGMAYQSGGKASQIAPISQSSIVITIILAFIFLRERDNIYKKILGAILVSVGVLFLK